jgi:hypothetical protein
VGDVVILGVDTIAERASDALRTEYDRLETLQKLRFHAVRTMDLAAELAPSFSALEKPFQDMICRASHEHEFLLKYERPVEARIEFLEGTTSMLSHLVNST